LRDVKRNADQPFTLIDGVADRLPYPMRGVGPQTTTACLIVAMDRLQQSDDAFLRQIVKAQEAALIPSSNRKDQIDVRFHEPISGREVPGPCPQQQLLFFQDGKPLAACLTGFL